jgi:hypothetical protein
MNTPTKHEFEFTESLSLVNSFGTIREEQNVLLHVTIGINSDTYGWFEFYDVESGGSEWYSEGGIWIENKTITDYDGIFALPKFITDKLAEIGYNVENVTD